MTPASRLVEKVTKDKLRALISLLETHPIHKVSGLSKKVIGVSLNRLQCQKIYDLHFENNNKHSVKWTSGQVLKNEEFNDIVTLIKERCSDEIADFIYHHWKQFEKMKKE